MSSYIQNLQELQAKMGSDATEFDAYYVMKELEDAGYSLEDVDNMDENTWLLFLDSGVMKGVKEVTKVLQTVQGLTPSVKKALRDSRIRDALQAWLADLDKSAIPGVARTCLADEHDAALESLASTDISSYLPDFVKDWTAVYKELKETCTKQEAEDCDKICNAILKKFSRKLVVKTVTP